MLTKAEKKVLRELYKRPAKSVFWCCEFSSRASALDNLEAAGIIESEKRSFPFLQFTLRIR